METVLATPKKKTKYIAQPGHYARCRKLAGNDMAAGLLLYTIYGRWNLALKKKSNTGKNTFLQRKGVPWIAMSRENWAIASGLTLAETKNRALPRLKKSCGQFIRFEAWRLNPTSPKQLWINLDKDGLEEASNESLMEEAALANG
jgi:hypothetical protein